MPAPEPVALRRAGRRCRLKWHRARRHADDTPFTAERIRQGLAAGASVEIDITPLACGGWAVLHDATLDRETTGRGPVAATTGAELAALRLRDAAGRPSATAPATLAALAARAAEGAVGAGALLQLDLKVGEAEIAPAHVAGFAAAVAPLARHVILSGGDAGAVRRLAAAAGVATGFDPCHEEASIDLLRAGRAEAFVTGALAALPGARIIYLDRRLVLGAAARGIDLIGPFQAAGREVDVYTIPDASPPSCAEVLRLLELGADQITTDDPAGLAAALGG